MKRKAAGPWIIIQSTEEGDVVLWKATKSKPQVGKLVSGREDLDNKHRVLAILPEKANDFLEAIDALDHVPRGISSGFHFSGILDLIVSFAVQAGMTQEGLKEVNFRE